MKPSWSDFLLAFLLSAAGCTLVYIGFARALRRAIAGRQLDTERRIAALAIEVETLRMRISELRSAQSASAPRMVDSHDGASTLSTEGSGEPTRTETLAVISAAATAFVGKRSRIRDVNALPAENAAGAWAQQGRVIVQTSHNLRPGGVASLICFGEDRDVEAANHH